MRISIVPVPARCLPEGVNVGVTEGPADVVYLVNEEETLEQICRDLSTVSTEYVAQAWLHVGSMGDQLQDAG